MPEITVIAHNIRSTHNVGAIFRTCEGFGIEKLILSGYTPYPVTKNDARLPHIYQRITRQIQKTALGAEEMVPFEYVEDLDDWISRHPLPVIALEQHASSKNLRSFTPPSKFALLLGEEVRGISEELINKCTAIVEIPMVGKKESFNVSVAAGIALYDLST